MAVIAPGPASTSEPTCGSRNDPGRGPRRPLTWVALALGYVALVVVLYAAAIHAFVGDSDGATVVLEGQAMGSGHVLLYGWALSLDSFWTVDAVAYMLVELVTGMRGALVHLVPAMIAAGVIVLGACLARWGRRGAAAVAAAATVVALLAMPSHVLAVFFLRGPLHVGTALLCLAAFAGLCARRARAGWCLAVVCLAAGTLGDFQMVALGTGAVVGAGVVAALRARRLRAAVRDVGAAAASVLLAGAIRVLAGVVGTFSVNPSHPRASVGEMVTNLHRIPAWGAEMLGVGNGVLGGGGVPTALEEVHVVGLVLVVAGVAAGTVALVRGAVRGPGPPGEPPAGRHLDDLLVLGFLAALVVFAAFTSSDDTGYMRYLTSAVVFGSVLSGRWVGRVAAGVRSPRMLRRGLAGGAIVVFALGAAEGLTVAAPRPAAAPARLDGFLVAHGLRTGIGDYWSASITTVVSDGSVVVRPVVTTPAGRVVRYQRQSAVDWYAGKSFQFLVYDTGRPWGGIQSTTAALTFGPVERTYVVGSYRVLVWDHRVSVPAQGFAPVPVVDPAQGLPAGGAAGRPDVRHQAQDQP